MEANSMTKRLLQGFIWQREAFKLELVRDKGIIVDTIQEHCHVTRAYHLRGIFPAWTDELWRLGGRRMAHRIHFATTQRAFPGSLD